MRWCAVEKEEKGETCENGPKIRVWKWEATSIEGWKVALNKRWKMRLMWEKFFHTDDIKPRDVERRLSYSTLSDLSPSISDEVYIYISVISSLVSKSFLLPGNVLRCMKMYTKCCQDISESQDTRSLLIGLFTTAFAGLCFTSGNTMVKLLPPGSSYDILLLRSLIQVHIIYEYIMDCWMTRSQQLYFCRCS